MRVCGEWVATTYPIGATIAASQPEHCVHSAPHGRWNVTDDLKRMLEETERIRQLADSVDYAKKLRDLAGVDDIAKKLRDVVAPSQALREALSSIPRVDVPPLPTFEPIPVPEMPPIVTPEEANSYQSAGVLLRRLARSVSSWRAQLPPDAQPAIFAILHGGIQLSVDSLEQASFHGIRIEGRLEGSPCVVLAHQATVQLLCFVQPVAPPEHPRRPIGFVVDGKTIDT